jgi:hypothetical protein
LLREFKYVQVELNINQRINKWGEDAGKKEPSYTVGGNVD